MAWRQAVLEKRHKIKTQRIGEKKRGRARFSEGQVLNRVVRWTPEGQELEADFRHAELIIEQLELENSRPVVTAGVVMDAQCAAWDVEGDEPEGEELPPGEATRFRTIGAHCNYLQPDRPIYKMRSKRYADKCRDLRQEHGRG